MSELPERGARGRGRPRDLTADTRILDAAAHLILTRGFDRTTIDDVAELAAVGKATVYRRWARKDELVLAAMLHLYATRMPITDLGDLRSDLLQTYTGVLQFSTSELGIAYVRLSMAESLRDERIAVLYREAAATARRNGRRAFERAVERGELDTDADLDFAMDCLPGVIALRIMSHEEPPGNEGVSAVVDFVLRGLGWKGPCPTEGTG